jgi:hypothetical protein
VAGQAIPQQLKCRICGSAFRNCRITKLRQPWVISRPGLLSADCRLKAKSGSRLKARILIPSHQTETDRPARDFAIVWTRASEILLLGNFERGVKNVKRMGWRLPMWCCSLRAICATDEPLHMPLSNVPEAIWKFFRRICRCGYWLLQANPR